MSTPQGKRGTARLMLVGLSAAALAVAYGGLLELLRVHWLARGSEAWAAQRPPLPELTQQMLLVACTVVIIWLTDVLFRDYQVVSDTRRRTMVAIWGYSGLLNMCGMAILFLEPAHGERLKEWLVAPRVLGLPLLVLQVRSFLTIYLLVDVRLRNERELSARLYLQSTSDALTGLANRTVFHERLTETLRLHPEQPVCVLFIDLDRFKLVNDSLGHEAGDLLLKEVAERLSRGPGEDGLLCRNGGDEFLAFCTGEGATREGAERLTQRLLHELSLPLSVLGEEMVCTASIGVATYPEDGTDMATLVRSADQAMYSSKRRGRNVLTLFQPHMGKAGASPLTLENDLRHALRRGEFFLEYQPQVSLITGVLLGVEALVRWNHPTRGRLGPDQFITAAEESDLIGDLDAWVLDAACAQMAIWRATGAAELRLAVNLSARNFYRSDLVSTVERTLTRRRMPASLVELELTETALLQASEESAGLLRRLKARGCRLSLDDFGTGYSSLAHLHRFPVDALKIDRSLVAEVVGATRAASLVGAVMAVGKGLSLEVVAEGVETQEQLEALRRLGCTQGQGYLFSRPLGVGALTERLRRQEPFVAVPLEPDVRRLA